MQVSQEREDTLRQPTGSPPTGATPAVAVIPLSQGRVPEVEPSRPLWWTVARLRSLRCHAELDQPASADKPAPAPAPQGERGGAIFPRMRYLLPNPVPFPASCPHGPTMHRAGSADGAR